MDIIAAHQQGLIERLGEEAEALAGRPADFGQRAVVLHHLFDHSVGGHCWALLEARRQLDTAKALADLQKAVSGFWISRTKRDAAAEAIDRLSTALGEAARSRCTRAYIAYRMTATAATEEEASAALSPDLALLLGECHARRRAGMPLSATTRQQLCGESESVDEDDDLASAWAMIATTGLGKAARKQIRDGIAPADFDRAEKKGWDRLEKRVRNDPALPIAFRANPAQHFYALQNGLAEKRRKELREAADADGVTVAIIRPIAA